MSEARDSILAAVRSARPAPVTAPDVRSVARAFTRPAVDPVVRFAEVARAAGSVVETTQRDGLAARIRDLSSNATRVLSTIPALASSIDIPRDLHDLAELEMFVAEGRVGVAECGALWVAPEGSAARAALFLAAHVVLVVACEAIVHDLHEAYERIDIGTAPFGVFVAGPSKTADIEQALVIGAHGPKNLTVLLLDRSVNGER